MAFTTQIFTFIFFPFCIVIYYLTTFLQSRTPFASAIKKIRLNDLSLIGISSVFYAWALFDDVLRFALYIFIVYVLGSAIQHIKEKKCYLVAEEVSDDGSIKGKKNIPISLFVLWISISVLIYVLFHFKYTSLFARMWNFIARDTITGKSIIAPLGISFITFSAVSYLVDIYKNKARSGNLIDCALYLSFFPKVVSGPIVLWRDFENQIAERRITLKLTSIGVSRIMIGFAKKLILADTFGACIDSASGVIDMPTVWGIGLLYMLQLYYDFSGYSDIAIGLSNMLGFTFKENFNFPYLSTSISELWRRWHISLGTWFREYVYIPLGGSRKGVKRTIVNVAIVFLLTGIWHGAGWAYILWGIANGICIIIEKLISNKGWYKKIPMVLKWMVTMGVTYFCWIPFRFGSFSASIKWVKHMLGYEKNTPPPPYTWQYYFDTRMIVLITCAVLGATLFGLPVVQRVYKQVIEKTSGYIIQQMVFVLIFILSILFMVNSTYSPFIYFQY